MTRVLGIFLGVAYFEPRHEVSLKTRCVRILQSCCFDGEGETSRYKTGYFANHIFCYFTKFWGMSLMRLVLVQ